MEMVVEGAVVMLHMRQAARLCSLVQRMEKLSVKQCVCIGFAITGVVVPVTLSQ